MLGAIANGCGIGWDGSHASGWPGWPMLRDPGGPRSFPPEEQHEVLALACHPLTELAAARTHWALRPLAEAAGTADQSRRQRVRAVSVVKRGRHSAPRRRGRGDRPIVRFRVFRHSGNAMLEAAPSGTGWGMEPSVMIPPLSTGAARPPTPPRTSGTCDIMLTGEARAAILVILWSCVV